ncbi:MAG: hypothetical protein [Caudoviricetes sp.]|nr:MAG: hypothetical protein [Caudoviricetes sp.]
MNDKRHFISEAMHAKVVECAGREALLIGGRVIQFDQSDADAADLISTALRSIGREAEIRPSGVICSGATNTTGRGEHRHDLS